MTSKSRNIAEQARKRLLVVPRAGARAAFFAHMALKLELREDPSFPTCYTDGRILGFNPAYFEALCPACQEAEIAHEVGHCAKLHMTRRGSRDPHTWNLAGDRVIDAELDALGFYRPCSKQANGQTCIKRETGHVVDSQYLGKSTEQVYAELRKNPPPKPQGGSGGRGNGCCKDAASGASPADGSKVAADVDRDWASAAHQAKAMADKLLKKAGKGSLGVDLGAIAGDLIPMEDILARYLTAPGDYTWTRPDRRYSVEMILPSQQTERSGHVVVVVDCSGSISQRDLNIGSGAVGWILAQHAWPETLTVIYHDSRVTHHETQDGPELVLHAHGGGGTSFRPVFDWVAQQGIEPSVMLWFTDTYAGDLRQLKEPTYPVVWLVPQAYESAVSNLPFGETGIIRAE